MSWLRPSEVVTKIVVQKCSHLSARTALYTCMMHASLYMYMYSPGTQDTCANTKVGKWKILNCDLSVMKSGRELRKEGERNLGCQYFSFSFAVSSSS